MKDLLSVDWSTIPAPVDDGAAKHLLGSHLPDVTLPATNGQLVNFGELAGTSVFYIYPMTGRPGVNLPGDWDLIPGARGCTPQSCAFRDHFAELKELGVTDLFGLSTQSTDYQKEAVDRLHLPFPLLSDSRFELCDALQLPAFEARGERLLKRLTLIAVDCEIKKVFYPVFPPDQNAADVINWLRS